MATSQRSKTGCSLCRTRRKNCDETKPRCLRCVTSKRVCSYDYVKYPDVAGRRIKSAKLAPRSSHELLAKESQNNSAVSYELISPSIPPSLPTNIGLYTTSGISESISPESVKLHLEGDPDADNIPEEIRALISKGITLDKNVNENSLPFVLLCYSQWTITCFFEPMKVTNNMREHVIVQFSAEKTRKRAILVANVMEMFTKKFEIDGTRKSILRYLALDTQKDAARFIATSPSTVPVLHRHKAARTFDTVIEILGLQLRTQPMSDCIRSLEMAAPVFRRACPGPPGGPINLPSILLDFSLSLRHFATVDIMLSTTTGRPTHFRYEVPFSLELCDRIYHWQLQGNYGLQWLYGIPDQFIILFAWINSLSETPSVSGNLQLIAQIEDQLPRVKIAINSDKSIDLALRIQRTVVQECWRFAALIYFYMVLCKADAYDSRVQRAQQGYMRLVRSSRPGRKPDIHLNISMIVAGVATTQELDRDTLRHRFLGVEECAIQGTAASDLLLRLEDIWARTRDEGRAAVWSDLKIAYSRLAAK